LVAYARWLATQDQPYRPGSFGKELDGWLIEEKRLWSQRAPGNTCLSALRATSTFGSFAENDSKGCGTVMRSAPFGFLARRPEDMPYMFDIAVESARTTHGHPPGYLSAGALAWIISLIVQGVELRDAVQRAIRMLEDHPGSGEVRAALQKALQVAQEPAGGFCCPDWARGGSQRKRWP
jgi:ADP-ribosylglycohydrolase